MAKHQPLILFDIDRTLIDTDQLSLLQQQTLAQTLSVPTDEINDRFLEYYGTLNNTKGFDPTDLLVFLSKYYQFPLKKLATIFYQPANFQASLYPEVIKVLTKLRDQGNSLGLYSQGTPAFQEHKILANNLMKFFTEHQRYLKMEKMDPQLIENLPEGTIIIDDKAEVIDFLGKFPNIIPLHLVRNSQGAIGEYTLSTLNDLFPILRELRHA